MENLHMQECSSEEKLKKILINDYGYSVEELDICNGVMGVPISFLDKYCPEQFEIVGTDSPYFVDELGIKVVGQKWVDDYRKSGGTGHITANMRSLCLYENGIAKAAYKRLLIKRKET